jgi:hypothetical protein
MKGYRLDKKETTPSLEVDIRNASVNPLRNLEIVAVLYNQNENVEHISRTYLEEFPATSDRTIFFSWREPFDNFITKVEIFPQISE